MNQREAGGLGERILFVVEREKTVRGQFEGDGDMEEVHPSNEHLERMFSGQLASGANGRGPVELDVRPVAEPHFLFEEPNQLARLADPHQTCPLCLTEAVEHLDPVPRSPDNMCLGFATEESDRSRVMEVPPALVREPPRGVRIEPHFFRERRKAAPSNLGAFGSPTARFSATRLVMRGRDAAGGACLVWPFAGADAVLMQDNDDACMAQRQVCLDSRRSRELRQKYCYPRRRVKRVETIRCAKSDWYRGRNG